MRDDDRLVAEPQGVRGRDGHVGYVGVRESLHLRLPDDACPRRLGRLPALLVHAGRHVGMGDHASAGASQRNRAEVMIRMMMREHQPADRPVRHRADGANELLPLGGAREGVDHDNALGRHGEARVGPALRPPPGITHDGKDVRGERPNRKTVDTTARGDMMDATRSRDQRQRNASKGCYSTNLISTL